MFLSLLLTWMFTMASAVPTRFETSRAIHPRNETISSLDLSSDILTFNIDPDIPWPICGWTWDANINIKHRGDAKKTSALCNTVFNYITGPSNTASSKDVNISYLCDGVSSPTVPQGYGSRDIKFVLTAPLAFLAHQTSIPASLQVMNMHDYTYLNVPVDIGYKLSSKGELKWQYIYCP